MDAASKARRRIKAEEELHCLAAATYILTDSILDIYHAEYKT